MNKPGNSIVYEVTDDYCSRILFGAKTMQAINEITSDSIRTTNRDITNMITEEVLK